MISIMIRFFHLWVNVMNFATFGIFDLKSYNRLKFQLRSQESQILLKVFLLHTASVFGKRIISVSNFVAYDDYVTVAFLTLQRYLSTGENLFPHQFPVEEEKAAG